MSEVDNLGQIKVFIQAAEARSFTIAARTLAISPSGVGKAIARLEDRVGVRLFNRNTRTIALTHEGALFLERCQRILSELEAAEIELSATHQAPRGKLNVSLPLVGMLIMPALTRFMRAYPSIELDLDFTDRLVDLINEGFDVVVRTGDIGDSLLKARMLGRFRHQIVGSPGYFDERGIPQTPVDLHAHDCVHHKYPGTGKLAPWIFSRDGEDFTMSLPRTVVASTIEPMVYMAEQGLGLACLPDYAVHDQIVRGTLRPVLAPYMKQEGVFHALWPANRYHSPKIVLFVEFLSSCLLPGGEGA